MTHYDEPTISGSSCTSPSEVVWAGLGGWNGSSKLAQDGTGYNFPGVGNHQSWIEELPNGPIAQPVYGVVGTAMALYVQDIGSEQMKYFIENSAGQYVNPVYFDNNEDDSTADFIFEAPIVNKLYTPLADFGVGDFTYAGTNFGAVGSKSNTEVVMNANPSGFAAVPSGLVGGNSFTDTWENCHTYTH